MEKPLLSVLRRRAPGIRQRWEKLIRTWPAESPQADPDVLACMIPGSIEEVLAELGKRYRRAPVPLVAARGIPRPRFPCGLNPYVNYFKAGERALLEALVLAQYELNSDAQRDAELAEFYCCVRKLALRETRGFCTVCNDRGRANCCRFATGESSRDGQP